MSFLLPVDRLLETDTLLAFYHPRPSYPVHVLLIPKSPFASLLDVPADDPFPAELFQAVQTLVPRLGLRQGYRLIANGGDNQDVPHLHFHLIAGE